ncbi:MAG: hypothetical protein KI793_33045 [Rivularia sp. (in: Bacteria)]|nr:hypothetical protein [Rivularia sp. MS3]
MCKPSPRNSISFNQRLAIRAYFSLLKARFGRGIQTISPCFAGLGAAQHNCQPNPQEDRRVEANAAARSEGKVCWHSLPSSSGAP